MEINPVKDTGVIRRPVRLAEDVKNYNANETEAPWIPDKAGYFLIRTVPESNKIQVGIASYKDINVITHLIVGTMDDRIQQKTLENGLMENAYKGGPLTKIYQTVIKEGLVTRLDHASYLGKELGRAWTALRLGMKYEQDGISI